MMKHLKISFMACMVTLLAVSFAFAGTHRQIVAEVPHDFVVGGTTMPAGTYFLEREQANPPMITLRNDSGEGSAIMHVTSTVERAGMDQRDVKLVFDKSESSLELSEVWFAGQDGFKVCAAVDAHNCE